MSAREHLERALAASADDSLLHALLDAWRTRHDPAISELVELAGRRAAAARPPLPTPARRDEQHAQWMQVVATRDPVLLDWLIERLVTSSGESSKEQVKALVLWPDDPRLAPRLLEVARSKPLTSRQNRLFWTLLWNLVHRQLHPGIAPIIAELEQTERVTEFDGLFLKNVARVRISLAVMPAPAEGSPVETQLLAQLASKLAVTQAREHAKTADDFLREIWAAPDDDGPREVFADWLLERGDPRGELISLQLARWRQGPATTKTRRERALLDEHLRDWLGALDAVVTTTAARFERGFLYACKVHWRRLAAAPTLMTHPAWATVREFTIAPEGERACDPWIDHMIALGAKRR